MAENPNPSSTAVGSRTKDTGGRKRPRAGVLVEPFQRQMYEMIVRQLHHDGFVAAASAVADAASVCLGSTLSDGVGGDRLAQLAADGMVVESMQRKEMQAHQALHVVERYLSASKLYLPLHLANAWQTSGKQYRWRRKFASSSLGGVIRDIDFSHDGAYAACSGTKELALVLSLRTMEDVVAVEHARAANRQRGEPTAAPISGQMHNVNEITDLSIARRLTGYSQSVEVIRFHPDQPYVLCGSRGGELGLHNISSTETDLQQKLHRDTFPIRTAAWHPGGEYILFGTDHPTPRLLNIHSRSLFFAPQTLARPGESSAPTEATDDLKAPLPQQHTGMVTSVEFSHDGRTWASASVDGSWALCDGGSGKMVHKVAAAHSAVPVTSITYSRTGNILLTSGMDSTARLWDLRYLSQSSTAPPSLYSRPSSCEVMSFGMPAKSEHISVRAVFTSDESHVLCQSANLTSINGYCVYTGDTVYTLETDPPLMQRGLAVRPFGNTVLTGGDDCRLRMWTPSLIPN